jgi:hypothetical protein
VAAKGTNGSQKTNIFFLSFLSCGFIYKFFMHKIFFIQICMHKFIKKIVLYDFVWTSLLHKFFVTKLYGQVYCPNLLFTNLYAQVCYTFVVTNLCA